MKLIPLHVEARFHRFWGALTIGSALLLAGCAAFVPERAWANGLLIAYFVVTLGLGGAVFLALANVTGASWHVAFRRIPEALTRLLPFGGAVLLGLLVGIITDRQARSGSKNSGLRPASIWYGRSSIWGYGCFLRGNW
jgi:hypothetical protein